MRLDKFLSETGSLSRSEYKNKILKGKVLVNNEVVKRPEFSVNENSDRVCCDGIFHTYEKYVYFMLNKPEEIVSATTDSLNKTVIDVFAKENVKGIFPVGRLDKDTTGLLIVTNDGELSHKLTSPKKHCEKVYEVDLEHSLSEDDIQQLETGLDIHDDKPTLPAKVQLINPLRIRLTIVEGRYHQVKRMIHALNNEVLHLHRVSIGNLILDEKLSLGEYRRLTNDEIEGLKSL